MKIFLVVVPLKASTIIQVEAENKKQALEKAKNEAEKPEFCYQCSESKSIAVRLVDKEILDIDCVIETSIKSGDTK